MQRYGSTPFSFVRQPRPGDRESRFPTAKNPGCKRPRIVSGQTTEEASHV